MLCICMCNLTVLFAQTRVTGLVKDETGESLPGVSVVEIGTTNGVITDANGRFEIRVADIQKGKLRFSYICMNQTNIALNGMDTFNVTMEDVLLMFE